MCAIAGIIGRKTDREIIYNMLNSMQRRGPDGHGVYQDHDKLLLHSRLAIIDLTGGAQPMKLSWAGERYVITYNGELYNTPELRRELRSLGHEFSTHSDTEVLLHAYAQWKEDSLQRLNGIFAFAVLEEKSGRVFLARDRIGVKPLFYSLHNGCLTFASEIKTLLASGIEARLDASGVHQLMLLGPGRIPGSGVLKDIYEIEPGQFAFYSGGKLSPKCYWRLTDREHTDSFLQTRDRVRDLVTDAAKRQMVSDVPIGTFLSGGLDSSILSAVCAAEHSEKGECLSTFSVDYQDQEKHFIPGKFQPNSDSSFIRLMQRNLQTNHHWTVLTPEALLSDLEASVEARDLPGMADVDISLLSFCRDIRGHVKVALSGECADEIFGGYPWYRDPAVRDTDGFPWAQNTDLRAKLIHPDFARQADAREFVYAQYRDTVESSDILPGTPALERRMKQMTNLNFRWFMQTLLDRKDRMSMYHGLEVRVPFCDHRIAEYLYSVPWEMKDYQSREKGLLREAMRGLLPEEILFRKKSPYPKTHDPIFLQLVTARLMKLLEQKDAPVFQILDRNALNDLLQADFSWPWYGQLMGKPQTICYFLQLTHWLEKYRIAIT